MTGQGTQSLAAVIAEMERKEPLGDPFADMVQRLAKPGGAICESLTPFNAHLWHMATGVAGVAGELLDAIKKVAIYNRSIDRRNVIEELGDIEFYMEGIRAALSIPREETIAANMHKLADKDKGRYANGYSDQAAQTRRDKLNDEDPQMEKGSAIAATSLISVTERANEVRTRSGAKAERSDAVPGARS